MPYKSKAHMRAFFAMEERGELPKGTAKKWAEETQGIKNLPERVGKVARKKSGKIGPLAKAAAKAYEKTKAGKKVKK